MSAPKTVGSGKNQATMCPCSACVRLRREARCDGLRLWFLGVVSFFIA